MIGTATQKPRPRVLVQAEKRRQKIRTLRDASAIVKKRDGGRCRACGKLGNQAHHLIYRSHGGSDRPDNLVWCCSQCHRLIHAKVLLVTFTGRVPEAGVQFTRNTQWESSP